MASLGRALTRGGTDAAESALEALDCREDVEARKQHRIVQRQILFADRRQGRLAMLDEIFAVWCDGGSSGIQDSGVHWRALLVSGGRVLEAS